MLLLCHLPSVSSMYQALYTPPPPYLQQTLVYCTVQCQFYYYRVTLPSSLFRRPGCLFHLLACYSFWLAACPSTRFREYNPPLPPPSSPSLLPLPPQACVQCAWVGVGGKEASKEIWLGCQFFHHLSSLKPEKDQLSETEARFLDNQTFL